MSIEEFMQTEAASGKTLSLGIDKEARLYVNGERVKTEQKVSLSRWINFAAVLGGLGAFAQGIAAICTLYK
jgi:hypothetical protein